MTLMILCCLWVFSSAVVALLPMGLLSQSYVLQLFATMATATILLGLACGLVLLPVLLALVGPAVGGGGSDSDRGGRGSRDGGLLLQGGLEMTSAAARAPTAEVPA